VGCGHKCRRSPCRGGFRFQALASPPRRYSPADGYSIACRAPAWSDRRRRGTDVAGREFKSVGAERALPFACTAESEGRTPQGGGRRACGLVLESGLVRSRLRVRHACKYVHCLGLRYSQADIGVSLRLFGEKQRPHRRLPAERDGDRSRCARTRGLPQQRRPPAGKLPGIVLASAHWEWLMVSDGSTRCPTACRYYIARIIRLAVTNRSQTRRWKAPLPPSAECGTQIAFSDGGENCRRTR
jgi:hypothetical protein